METEMMLSYHVIIMSLVLTYALAMIMGLAY